MLSASTQADLDKAIQQTKREPTDEEKKSGQYPMGSIEHMGMVIRIENAKGSVRSGIDPDGNRWESILPAHYGHIRYTKGNDGDEIDVFIGDHLDSKIVTIIDQCHENRLFDEHKVMLGYRTREEAIAGYYSAYETGWDRVLHATTVSIDVFMKWLSSEDKRIPFHLSKKPRLLGEMYIVFDDTMRHTANLFSQEKKMSLESDSSPSEVIELLMHHRHTPMKEILKEIYYTASSSGVMKGASAVDRRALWDAITVVAKCEKENFVLSNVESLDLMLSHMNGTPESSFYWKFLSCDEIKAVYIHEVGLNKHSIDSIPYAKGKEGELLCVHAYGAPRDTSPDIKGYGHLDDLQLRLVLTMMLIHHRTGYMPTMHDLREADKAESLSMEVAKTYTKVEHPTHKGWYMAPGYPPFAAREDGSIMNTATGNITKGSADDRGYLRVALYDAKVGKKKDFKSHVIVCSAFHGPRPSPQYDAAHDNDKREDNRASNLRWITHAENMKRANENRRSGTMESDLLDQW